MVKNALSLCCGILILLGMSGCIGHKPFTAKEAKEKGYVVMYEIGGKADNVIKMVAFSDKVEHDEKAKVNIVDFSGKTPLINAVSYDGKLFKWTQKNSPADKGKTRTCKQFIDSKMGIFNLLNCNPKTNKPGILAVQDFFYQKAVKEYQEQQNK